MYSITELDAINQILKPIDGTKLSTLNVPLNRTINTARQALAIATDLVQVENQWNFHMDGPLELSSDGDGEIIMPPDYLWLQFVYWSQGFMLHLTVRDGKAWDTSRGTAQVGGTVKVIGARRFSFEECPYAIQNLMIQKAKMEYLALDTHVSRDKASVFQAAIESAYASAYKWDSQLQANQVSLMPSLRQTIRQRGGNRGWWWGY